MDSLLFEAKQQQLASIRQQLWMLVDFNTDVRSVVLSFTPAQIGSPAGIQELCQKLPAVSKTHAAAKCLYYLEADNAAAVVTAFDGYMVRTLAAATDKRTNPHSISRRQQHSEGNCLYVGSSALANFEARFKRHCGYYGGQDRTFGLKLNKWLHTDDVTLKLHYWLFDALDQEVLQLLEDGLWECKKPLFGRKGSSR